MKSLGCRAGFWSGSELSGCYQWHDTLLLPNEVLKLKKEKKQGKESRDGGAASVSSYKHTPLIQQIQKLTLERRHSNLNKRMLYLKKIITLSGGVVAPFDFIKFWNLEPMIIVVVAVKWTKI